MDPAASFLLTDLYQLAMMQAYVEEGETGTAVFEFFARKLPTSRGFLMAAGLEQALVNLVGNAVKFSNPHTVVETVIETHEDSVRIHVLDRGPGLTSDDLERAFRKFARLSARPTAGESSTGLGLYITHRLLERMGGQVEAGVRSGGGARFTLILPGPESFQEENAKS